MTLRLVLTILLLAAAPAALARDEAMRDIMAGHVNPGALGFWAAGNDPPDNETPAQAKLRWDEAAKGAKAMETWGQVLQKPPYTRTGRWNDDAQLMIDMARLGETPIRLKDGPKAFEIGGRLYDACNECHKLYVPRRGATIPRESPLNAP
ncbi:MAG: hypothetical protein E7812_01485 [Phenylobacterium sp.]|nr:MAG: hypothetical protein E7812_01485 [Phenylobacterium sp.]